MSTAPKQRKPAPSRWRWAAVGSAVVAVAALALASLALLRGDDTPRTAATPTPTTAAPSSRSAAPSSAAPAASRSQAAFAYLPLWPFASADDAARWQRDYRRSGHQPWHLDAAETALAFTRGYLGYTGVDQVTSTTVRGRQAWAGVGPAVHEDDEDGHASTAAVLHLAKLGTGGEAPWEVVGTRDSTLSLEVPHYGATVTSPLRVGGRVTGVDENLRIQVHHLRSGLVGETGGVPAGGSHTTWHDTVTFDAPSASVLTVVVVTGGHAAGVERFALTGVRVG